MRAAAAQNAVARTTSLGSRSNVPPVPRHLNVQEQPLLDRGPSKQGHGPCRAHLVSSRGEGQCGVVRKGWEPYEDELHELFGFVPDRDPDPTEWLSPEEFQTFKPYLEIVRKARRASLRAEDALGGRRLMARNTVGRNRATKAYEKASAELEAARAQQKRLDRSDLGELRLRAENRLRLRRQGLALPPDLSFS